MENITENPVTGSAAEKYTMGIVYAVFAIITAYLFPFISPLQKYTTMFLCIELLLASIGVLLEFKKYLRKFDDPYVWQPVNWAVIADVMLGISYAAFMLLISHKQFYVHNMLFALILVFVSLIFLASIICSVTVCIILGVRLKRTVQAPGDLIQMLSTAYIFLVPVLCILAVVLAISKHYLVQHLPGVYIGTRIVFTTLGSIPNFLLIAIFSKGNNRSRQIQ